MTSNTYYRERFCPFDVIECMEKDYFGILDHRITNIFLRNIAAYYLGEMVMLSNGEIGEIVHINPFNTARPIIKSGNKYIDLSTESKLRIAELL